MFSYFGVVEIDQDDTFYAKYLEKITEMQYSKEGVKIRTGLATKMTFP